jgi:P4 family phage/plasmid primase-like protien
MNKIDNNISTQLKGVNGIFNKYVSLFDNALTTINPKYLTIKDVLYNIQNGIYKNEVIKARELYKQSKDDYGNYKKNNIAGFTLSAYCNHRIANTQNNRDKYGIKFDDLQKNKLIYHTGLLQIDIDNISNTSIADVRSKLQNDNYTFFCFKSLSGNGLKIAIKIDSNKHKETFLQAENYYKETYNFDIDKSVKDIYRLCFISYDTELFVNPKSKLFTIKENNNINQNHVSAILQKPKIKFNNINDNDKFKQYAEQGINNAIQIINNSTKGNKHNSRLRAGYLLGGYVAGNFFTKEYALNEIKQTVLNNTDLQIDIAIKTVEDALNEGRAEPITFEMLNKKRNDYLVEKYGETYIKKQKYKKQITTIQTVNKETGEVTETFVIDDDFIWECLQTDERGDAMSLAKINNNTKVYDKDEKEWYSYNGSVWIKDKINITRKESVSLLADVYLSYQDKINQEITELQKKVINDKDNGLNDKIKTLSEKRNFILKRTKKLNTRNRINNVLDLCSDYLPILTHEFDANNDLINLQNGIYDLKNDNFREHTYKDKFKKIAGATYKEVAFCDQWLLFLDKIFNKNDDLIYFIQKLCGNWLSGRTDLQNIFFAFGTGANGKSTFFNVMQMILNGIDDNGNLIDNDGYFTKIKIDTLLIKKFIDNTSDYQVAKLQGVRLAIASEIPKNCRLNENLIKDLTGGDSINARHPYGRPFTFCPTQKLVIFGNNKPNVKDSTEGFWRRMLLLPFDYTIPKSEQKRQSEMLNTFRKELSGILNWCLEGWRNYKNQGLMTPDIVTNATKEYQNETDILSDFFDNNKDDYIINKNDKSLHIKAELLYNSYLEWCKKNSEQVINPFETNRHFYKALRDKGFKTQNMTDNKLFVLGINNTNIYK